MLSREEVAQIYASPLARTRETAEILKKHTDANVLMDDRLREVAFGDYEGKTVDFSDLTFVKARRAHKLEQNQIESIYHFPGMETWSAVEARTGEFLKKCSRGTGANTSSSSRTPIPSSPSNISSRGKIPRN